MAPGNHRPVLIVIAGPNGSGKTSVTSKILHHEWLEDSEYINPDNVARDVFGDWNNQESVLKAANYCNEWRKRCLAERKSHIFETVMSVVAAGIVAAGLGIISLSPTSIDILLPQVRHRNRSECYHSLSHDGMARIWIMNLLHLR